MPPPKNTATTRPLTGSHTHNFSHRSKTFSYPARDVSDVGAPSQRNVRPVLPDLRLSGVTDVVVLHKKLVLVVSTRV
jgi:hypothetical protein